MTSRTPDPKTKSQTPAPSSPTETPPATDATKKAVPKPAPAKRSNARKGPAPKGRHRW